MLANAGYTQESLTEIGKGGRDHKFSAFFFSFFFFLVFSKGGGVPSADFQTRKFTHGRKSAVIKRLLPSAFLFFFLPFQALGEGDFNTTMCSESDFFLFRQLAFQLLQTIFILNRFSNKR